MQQAQQAATTVYPAGISNPFRRRRRPRVEQTEIQPASSSGVPSGRVSSASSFSQPATTVPDLIEQLRSPEMDKLHHALNQIIAITKEPNEGVVTEFVTNGALPALIQILTRNEFSIQLRIRVAAAVCNLSQARHSLRSFVSCDAVPQLVEHVIGEHQALTGAVALMFRSMLISENLVRAMIESNAPIVLLRGLMLCTSTEISDTIVDVLVQMSTISEIKEYLVQNRAVESCVYFLHVLARSHYRTCVIQSTEFHVNPEDCGRPSFMYKSMRDALVWSLLQPEGIKTHSRIGPRLSQPETTLLVSSRKQKDWEELLKMSPVIGTDQKEINFCEDEYNRAALFIEILTSLVSDSPFACSRLASMQFSLDILAYWIQRGNCLIKQGGILTTCSLLRHGHRGFITLKHVIQAIVSVLDETERNGSGVSFSKYKCVAAEAVNDLCHFGGDNVRITVANAEILRMLLGLVNVADVQLQHFTLRAIHTVCTHPIALARIVECGAIPFLCHFLAGGMKEAHNGPHRPRSVVRNARGCLSRKRGGGPCCEEIVDTCVCAVATISMSQAEIEHAQRQEQDYSRQRRLDYAIALLRLITAVQSPEWFHDLNKCRIAAVALDALVQRNSMIMRRQALGILVSIVTFHDANIMTNICLEGGCEWLLNLRRTAEQRGDSESPYWRSWTNFILYYIFQNVKTRRFVEQALRQEYGDSIDLNERQVQQLLKPDQNYLDLEWIARIS